MPNAVAGYIGVTMAVVFFGTTYVPAKQYPTYDGMVFQWYMCSGILAVGLLWGLFSNQWDHFAEQGMYMFPQGLFGGALFALANVLIPTVVNTLGLGVGFMLWNGANITMGYLVSRFGTQIVVQHDITIVPIGLFGVKPTIPSNPWLSALGILFMLASIVVYGKVQPKLAQPTKTIPEMTPVTASESTPLKFDSPGSSTDSVLEIDLRAMSQENLAESLIHPELPNYGTARPCLSYLTTVYRSVFVACRSARARCNLQLFGRTEAKVYRHWPGYHRWLLVGELLDALCSVATKL
ncbi:hypothetical protein AC1031_013538 [Aphanomyces cochlioides]|nr:hypothetical protein AC1031_013538 [Aphanomyces cochlioides]